MENNSDNFSFGINFHYFHDKNHLQGNDSLSNDSFTKIVKLIKRQKILNPEDFIKNLKKKNSVNSVCFTFDDGLRSQLDIALSVLEKFNINAFLFVPTIFLKGDADLMILSRFFKIIYFKNNDDFFELFYKVLNTNTSKFLEENSSYIEYQKKKYPFYSLSELKFRLIRNKYLSIEEVKEIFKEMFLIKNFDYIKYSKKIFLNSKDIKKIYNSGHKIGLHSHSHPPSIGRLSFTKQYEEYSINKEILISILKCNPNEINSMSHPLGSYNEDTFRVLKKLNIDIGFKETTDIDMNVKKINNSMFEIAREDCYVFQKKNQLI